MAGGAEMRHKVGTEHQTRQHVGDSDPVRAVIGALIVEERIVDGLDAAVPVEGDRDLVLLLARVVSGQHVFVAVFDPFYRTAQP